MGKRNMVRQVRDEPRAHRWDKKCCNGSENDPKTGGDAALRNFIVVRDTRSTLGPGTKRTASWETQETSDACTSPTTSPRRPDGRQIKQFKRQHIFVIINASSRQKFQRHVTVRTQAPDSRSQQSKTMESNVPVGTSQRRTPENMSVVCCRQRLRNFILGRPHQPSDQLNP